MGGLDMEQEWVKNATYYGDILGSYVANGTIPMSRLNEMARRVLLPMYALNYISPSNGGPNATANSTSHAELSLELAVASLALLKNEGPLLPLAPHQGLKIALIGDTDLTGGGGSGGVVRPFTTTLQSAVMGEFPGASVTYFQGNVSGAAAAAAAADVAVVVVSVWGSEGGDRANLSLGCAPMAGPQSCRYWPDQDALVEAVASAAPVGKTVVVVRAPGAVLMPWLGSVGAVVNQVFGGQGANSAVAGLLGGRFNPAGKLTVSFPKTLNDTWLSWPTPGGPINPNSFPGTDRGGGFPEVDYAEGLFVGYRWFDNFPDTLLAPLFPFGHGLSFSTFAYSALELGNNGTLTPSFPTLDLTFTLALASGPSGGEVSQLYVAGGLSGDPKKGLKGFAYTFLTPSSPSQQVRITLSLSDLVTWDVARHAFVPYPDGSYSVMVGSSSRDLRLAGTVTVRTG